MSQSDLQTELYFDDASVFQRLRIDDVSLPNLSVQCANAMEKDCRIKLASLTLQGIVKAAEGEPLDDLEIDDNIFVTRPPPKIAYAKGMYEPLLPHDRFSGKWDNNDGDADDPRLYCKVLGRKDKRN